MQDNKLINRFQNFQNRNMSFQNNSLLANHSNFSSINSNLIWNNSQQQIDVINELRDQQKIKQLEKLNELEQKIDKEKIKECVIKPIKIKFDNEIINQKWKELEKNYEVELIKYWKGRTNQPYKNILKNENYNRDYKTQEDLIVHRVTKKDKIGVDDEYNKFMNQLEQHNNELKMIYSVSKLAEHKKQFEYNHKYKYRVNYKPSDHEELKQDRINYFKKEQKKMEANKEKLDNIIETLINEGIFSEEEIASFKLNNN